MGLANAPFALALALGLWYCYWLWSRSTRRLPPGPKPVPILGNLHQLPMGYQHKTFSQWGQAHGDVVYAQLFRTPALVLNSLRAAQDLLDKRSAKYSDRPRAVMLTELLGWHPDLVFLPYGEQFRKHRRWIQASFLDKTALQNYQPTQRREAVTLLSGLVESPDAFEIHLKRFTAAMIMESTYGHSVTSIDDEFVRTVDLAMKGSVETGPAGATAVDFFPILRYVPPWLPGAGFMRHALHVRSLVRDAFTKPFGSVQEQLAQGRAKPCLAVTLLEDATRRGVLAEEKEDIMGACAVLYSAGTDTTNTVLLSFVLAMTLYPQVYRKAQEEVDRVVGHDRLPDFSDRESLPYVECLLKEVYRWNCPAPLSIAHRLMEDDEYRGYHIPKGVMVIPNLWNMTQDPEVYPQPETFRPERFQEMDTSTAESADPRNIIFGHGRRLCLGRHFADTSIWLVIVNILATLDIRKAKDGAGNDITPLPAFISGIISRPHEFVCSITPRYQRSIDLINESRASLAM